MWLFQISRYPFFRGLAATPRYKADRFSRRTPFRTMPLSGVKFSCIWDVIDSLQQKGNENWEALQIIRSNQIMPLKTRIHAPANARNFTPGKRAWFLNGVRRENLICLYIGGVARVHEKRNIGKSGTTTSATASGIFACVSSETVGMPARC